MQSPDARSELILKFGRNRALAHATLFKHRHPDETPFFHHKIIEAWHSDEPRILTEAFRGGAKSTIAEEVITIEACYNLFNNAILLGSSSDRANERLAAIKHELENNEYINELFGNMKGPTWNEDKIILSNGAIIQAIGRGQSLRGVKHLGNRPDRVYGDDMEDEESVATPEARMKFKSWFMGTVLPACDVKRVRIRILGTPLDPECFVELIRKSMRGWLLQFFPAEYISKETGERTAMWDGRLPLAELDRIRGELFDAGTPHIYPQEYLLQAEDPTQKKFQAEHIRVEATVRTWHPTLAVFDPARTVNSKTSATTGHVVGSWIGNKLLLWEGDGRFLMPDAIINEMFRIDEQYHPVSIGVEEDGLNEFIMQPLRNEQTKRQCTLPVRPLKAPKGKIQFIEALQPFFKAHEVVFATELPELKKQLLSFPTGRIDAPNALAYMLRLRPGMPIFENFGALNVAQDLLINKRSPAWLAVNATGYYTTGVLMQFNQGVLLVLRDWVREGDPGSALGDIVREASLEAQQHVRTVVPEKHYKEFDSVGLVPAAARIPIALMHGGPEANGREELRRMMRLMVRDRAAIQVSSNAHWTLNAFASGYCRAIQKSGVLSDFAEDGVYKVLMEGVEAFGALLQTAANSDKDDGPHYAFTDKGVRYLTALPQGR